MRRFLLFTLFLLVSFAFSYQRWERIYGDPREGGNDRGFSVQQTTDGGYIIAGYAQYGPIGHLDAYLIKTDSFGDTLWTRLYGEENYYRAYEALSVQQTTDGGYISAGWTTAVGAGAVDFFLWKTDSNGDTLWVRTYGGADIDFACSVQQTTDGGYIIGGFTLSFGAGRCDVYLVKTDSNGDTLWTRTYGGANSEIGHSVQQTADGGYIIAGWTCCPVTGDSGDVYLIKTDPNGDTIWTRTYGGAEDDRGYSVQQTSDGGYIITGGTKSFGAGDSNVYLVKTDGNGDTIWTKTYGGPRNDFGWSVQQTADGGYIITGETNFVVGLAVGDVYLVKTDANGDTLWTRTYGGPSDDGGYSVRQTADGGYIITGWKDYRRELPDVYLIKTDPLGLVYHPGVSEQRAEPHLLVDVTPNPFTKTATIRYQLPSASPVRILAFDITGRTVATLLDQNQPAGTHQLIWQPDGLAQGVYFIRLQLPGSSFTQRCLYLHQR